MQQNIFAFIPDLLTEECAWEDGCVPLTHHSHSFPGFVCFVSHLRSFFFFFLYDQIGILSVELIDAGALFFLKLSSARDCFRFEVTPLPETLMIYEVTDLPKLSAAQMRFSVINKKG